MLLSPEFFFAVSMIFPSYDSKPDLDFVRFAGGVQTDTVCVGPDGVC